MLRLRYVSTAAPAAEEDRVIGSASDGTDAGSGAAATDEEDDVSAGLQLRADTA